MKGNLTLRILWKIILLFIISTFLSAVTVYALLSIAQIVLYADVRVIEPFFRAISYTVEKEQVFFALTFLFFILILVLFVRKSLNYLSQIKNTVKELSRGNFERQVPVKSNDELGELAEYVNYMSHQLKAAIKEERLAVQAQHELITNVSHDLRTPLTSIIGYLRWMEEDRCKDEVELRHYINIVYEKSLRLGRMVEDLFEYTRMNHGHINLQISNINLAELLGQLAAEFTLQIQDQQMSIHLDCDEEGLVIQADGDKLMRVFENLIANAIKYGGKGKRIDISIKPMRDFAVIRVVNYGSPIPAGELHHIFDRFYRVDKSRSDETGGSGLGLAIAKSIIDLHQGKITVQSDEKKTMFEVSLPWYKRT